MEGCPSVTSQVIDAVASAEDRDPVELPPLQEVVETDALDALFDTARDAEASPVELCFCYSESIVTVHSEGMIDVTPRPPESETNPFRIDTE